MKQLKSFFFWGGGEFLCNTVFYLKFERFFSCSKGYDFWGYLLEKLAIWIRQGQTSPLHFSLSCFWRNQNTVCNGKISQKSLGGWFYIYFTWLQNIWTFWRLGIKNLIKFWLWDLIEKRNRINMPQVYNAQNASLDWKFKLCEKSDQHIKLGAVGIDFSFC